VDIGTIWIVLPVKLAEGSTTLSEGLGTLKKLEENS
jgi:hypothetical protein